MYKRTYYYINEDENLLQALSYDKCKICKKKNNFEN